MSNKQGIKTVIPRVNTTTRGVQTPTPIADGRLVGGS